LNFAVCCLTLSTLTTRFIFPMFSLEGRRLWILGLSPVGLSRVFWQKLGLFAVLIGMATGVLMLVSGIKLGMSRADLGFYCGSIVLMGGGLTGLALSLGAIFPNFVDHSPAKIVSGFGGTLCLILNFVYILGFLPIFVWPSLQAARPGVGAAAPSAAPAAPPAMAPVAPLLVTPTRRAPTTTPWSTFAACWTAVLE
jgi:ABC-2 type transport system permease protein